MNQNATRAVLLVNLGSPDSTDVRDVKKYLDEFLMDAHVLDYPQFVRAALVRGVILNVRPRKSAAAYKEIWWPEGSPLKVISERVLRALEPRLDVPVALAMRYQNPSIEAGLRNLLAAHPHLQEVLLVPLYPQYAMATTETVAVEARDALKRIGSNVELRVLPPFYDHDAFVDALEAVTRPVLLNEQGGLRVDRVLFSYHGIPKRHIRKSDCTGSHCLTVDPKTGADCCHVASPAHVWCYRHQAIRTTESLAARLNLQPEDWEVSFQSRLGGGWLTPFTDIRLKQLPKEGVKRLAVLCPAFVSDCLETLEEIAQEGKEIFLEAGGEEFTYVPCVNDDPVWIAGLEGLIREAWNDQEHFEVYKSIPNLVAAG
jgi:ferrochelatase